MSTNGHLGRLYVNMCEVEVEPVLDAPKEGALRFAGISNPSLGPGICKEGKEGFVCLSSHLTSTRLRHKASADNCFLSKLSLANEEFWGWF